MINFLRKMFCKHEWEVVIHETHEAPLKRIKKEGQVIIRTYSLSALYGKSIIILKCPKCGALNKTIERI